MPHTNTWTEDSLYRKFTGEIGPDEILISNFETHKHPKFSLIKYIINDFTEVTSVNIDNSHTKIYATTDDIISNTKGELKIAIVVQQEAHIDLANTYRLGMKNNNFECEIFKTLTDAENWAKS